MKQTEQIGSLIKALVKAQAEITHAIKDKENPHFKSDYATLESVINASKEALQKNGLVIIQTVTNESSLLTTLVHESGEHIESEMKLLVDRGNMQALGSAISYARRFSWAAMCGIAQTDDDANEASKDPQPPQKKPVTKQGEYFFPSGKHEKKHFSDLTHGEFNTYYVYLCDLVANNKANTAVLQLVDLMSAYKKEKGI